MLFSTYLMYFIKFLSCVYCKSYVGNFTVAKKIHLHSQNDWFDFYFLFSFCSSLAIKEFSLNCTTFEFLRVKIKYSQFCFKNFLQLSLSLVDKSCSFRTFIGRYFYSLTSLSVSHLNLYTLSSKLFATESPLKTMENAFLLHLKSTFCYQGI